MYRLSYQECRRKWVTPIVTRSMSFRLKPFLPQVQSLLSTTFKYLLFGLEIHSWGFILFNNKWIAHNVRGLDIRSSEDYAQNKMESEKLSSSYALQRGKYRTVHCTKHTCTPGWPDGRFFLSRYDGGNHVLRSVSLHVSDHNLLASFPCWPLHR